MIVEGKASLRRLLRGAWRRINGQAGRAPPAELRLADIDPEDLRIVEQVRPYTMTSLERLLALLNAVPYLIRNKVPGAFAECGVWRGGSVLAMMLKLKQLGINDRDIFLFDTFEGMTQPGAVDVSPYSPSPLNSWNQAAKAGQRAWHKLFTPEIFTEDKVRQLLLSTGYPEARLHMIRGTVEQTVPAQAPAEIALLRLDTDWYDSTRHEMVHLYPRIARGGVLIIDDYGHWEGARRAVDEYFASGAVQPVLLNRVDYSARLAVKL